MLDEISTEPEFKNRGHGWYVLLSTRRHILYELWRGIDFPSLSLAVDAACIDASRLQVSNIELMECIE